MNTNLPAETKRQHAYRELWGRSQSWFDQLEHSPRTLWTARDLLGEDDSRNRGACAHLGIYFKASGFSRRLVRGLIDVHSCRVLPQCTLWRTRNTPLPTFLQSDGQKAGLHWRMQYHKQVLQFADVGVEALGMVIASLCRDYHLDDPYRSPVEIRSSVEPLRAR